MSSAISVINETTLTNYVTLDSLNTAVESTWASIEILWGNWL